MPPAVPSEPSPDRNWHRRVAPSRGRSWRGSTKRPCMMASGHSPIGTTSPRSGMGSGVAADHVDGVVDGAEKVGADRLHPGAGRSRGAPGRTVGGVGVGQGHHDVVAQRPPARRPVGDQGDLHAGRVQGVERRGGPRPRRQPPPRPRRRPLSAAPSTAGPSPDRSEPTTCDVQYPSGRVRPARPDAAHAGVDGQGGDRRAGRAAGPAPRARGRRRVPDRAADPTGHQRTPPPRLSSVGDTRSAVHAPSVAARAGPPRRATTAGRKSPRRAWHHADRSGPLGPHRVAPRATMVR